MLPDKVREIIDVLEDDLPKGQRLLRLGYKPISEDEMKEMLGVGRLADEYNNNLRKEIRGKYKYWEEGYRSFRCYHGFFASISNNYEIISKKEGGITKTPLEGYAKKMVPPRCLQEVSKARHAGFEQFWVIEPTLVSPDPLIVGRFEESEDYWFITRWE